MLNDSFYFLFKVLYESLYFYTFYVFKNPNIDLSYCLTLFLFTICLKIFEVGRILIWIEV
jgi:hypothetical protein